MASISACDVHNGSAPEDAQSPSSDATTLDAVSDVTTALDADAAGPSVSGCDSALPSSLSCTGLYSDITSHTVAAGIRSFTPANPLWSDGAGKNRWIQLPQGGTIDRSNPNEWIFPPGTKLWKEFAFSGRRVETRLFHKQLNGMWAWVSYVWNADETEATAAPNGQMVSTGDGSVWQVPSQHQCSECHNGRTDHVMGFEEVSLGLPGATGLTLAQLTSEGLLSPPPTRTSLSIGDDGTGAAAAAMGWIHVNCGVSCHNSNPASTAGPLVGMRLRLDATKLDGRPSTDFDPIATTVGVSEMSIFWPGETRIVPGDPDNSLLVQLISRRSPGNQMPPLGTQVVDEPAVQSVRDWIQRMPSASSDGGVPGDAAPEAGSDLGPEAGTDDASIDASSDAATVEDAGDADDVNGDAGDASDF